jgi:hypothetical protein
MIAFMQNDDRELLHFDPTAPIPELTDPKPGGAETEDRRSARSSPSLKTADKT